MGLKVKEPQESPSADPQLQVRHCSATQRQQGERFNITNVLQSTTEQSEKKNHRNIDHEISNKAPQ